MDTSNFRPIFFQISAVIFKSSYKKLFVLLIFLPFLCIPEVHSESQEWQTTRSEIIERLSATPFREVRREPDFCQRITITPDMERDIDRMRSGDLTYMYDVPNKTLIVALAEFLQVNSKVPGVSRWVQLQTQAQRQAICAHFLGLVPRSGYNVDIQADLHSTSIAGIYDDMISIRHYPDHIQRLHYATLNKAGLLMISKALLATGQTIFPDKMFINRLSRTLEFSAFLVNKSPILELAAGNGVIARELNEKNFAVTAVDDLSGDFFKNPESKKIRYSGLKKMKAKKAIKNYQNHRIYVFFNAPSPLVRSILDTALDLPGPRVLLFSDKEVNTEEGREKIRLHIENTNKRRKNKKSIHIETLNMRVPLYYGYAPLMLVYADDLPPKDDKWLFNLNTILVMKKSAEAHLQSQIRKNPIRPEDSHNLKAHEEL